MTSQRIPVIGVPPQNSLAACIVAVLMAGAPIIVDAQSASGPRLPAMSSLAKLIERSRNVASSAMPQRTARPAAGTLLLATPPIVVTSCADDGGFDTLRHAALTANPGDVIDMTGATCGTITLQSGAISVNIDDLTIKGPGSGLLTIDANHTDRVFQHNGAGTLALYDLTIANGTRTADKAYGGCIYSKGSVSVNRSIVKSCLAAGQSLAAGGGIFTKVRLDLGSTTLSDNMANGQAAPTATIGAVGGGATSLGQIVMIDSIVSGNTVKAPDAESEGGGVLAPDLTVKYSTISGNHAIAGSNLSGNYSAGGGASGSSTTTIIASTIDGNDADVAGALFLTGGGMSVAAIANSTISSNVANLGIGAIDALVDVAIVNSTIAFNEGKTIGGPAVALDGGSGNSTVQSSIIADNSPQDLDGGGMIGGDHDLIKTAGLNVMVPTGTIALDPKLGPLQFNGGVTRTHALTAGSPAIDQGNVAIALMTDQRGPTYGRVVGAAADIGAFEIDTDHVFGSAFDLK